MATIAPTPKPAKPAGKQTSRRGKKAWRKNVDTTDVSTGLEQLRTEIISGGVLGEKPDEALFVADTHGAPETALSSLSINRRAPKPLRSDQILAQRSAIPALENRKRTSDVLTTTTDGVVPEKKKKRHRATGVSYRDVERLRRIAYGSDAARDGVKTAVPVSADFDPWEDIVTPEHLDGEVYTFIPKPQKKVEPVTLKKAPVNLAAGGEGEIPAVRLPNPGISYNPDFNTWDTLITTAGEAEVLDEQKRMAEAEHEAYILAKAAEEDADPSSASESESEDETEEAKEKAMYLKKRPERKTQVQRNRIKRRKEAEREAVRLSYLKKQKEQLQGIKKLAKSVREAEAERLAVAVKEGGESVVEVHNAIIRKRKFGRVAMPRAPLELQLPDELADSLRRLKPEGNLLRDRFRSLRERGILETRQPINQQKKVKKIITEKWSYKDWKF